MTGTRWFPVEDYGSKDHRVRLRDALWGGLATLRDEDGTLADPLIFPSRDAAFRWLRECAEVWDKHPASAPPRDAAWCTNCAKRTGRPVMFDSGDTASGPGRPARHYCPLCASIRLSPPTLMLLRRAHESVCAKCTRAHTFCHEREILIDTYDAAFKIASARNLGR